MEEINRNGNSRQQTLTISFNTRVSDLGGWGSTADDNDVKHKIIIYIKNERSNLIFISQ